MFGRSKRLNRFKHAKKPQMQPNGLISSLIRIVNSLIFCPKRSFPKCTIDFQKNFIEIATNHNPAIIKLTQQQIPGQCPINLAGYTAIAFVVNSLKILLISIADYCSFIDLPFCFFTPKSWYPTPAKRFSPRKKITHFTMDRSVNLCKSTSGRLAQTIPKLPLRQPLSLPAVRQHCIGRLCAFACNPFFGRFF